MSQRKKFLAKSAPDLLSFDENQSNLLQRSLSENESSRIIRRTHDLDSASSRNTTSSTSIEEKTQRKLEARAFFKKYMLIIPPSKRAKREGDATPETQPESQGTGISVLHQVQIQATASTTDSTHVLSLSKSALFSKSVEPPADRSKAASTRLPYLRRTQSESDLLTNDEGKKSPRHWDRQNPLR